MASDDPESSTAEDRAVARWEREPWPDGGDDNVPHRYQQAFRDGFRAGREHVRQNPAGRLERPRETPMADRVALLEAGMRILNANQSAAEGRIRALEESEATQSLQRRVDELTKEVCALDERTIGSLRIGGGAE
jgi:hypothetical protein